MMESDVEPREISEVIFPNPNYFYFPQFNRILIQKKVEWKSYTTTVCV